MTPSCMQNSKLNISDYDLLIYILILMIKKIIHRERSVCFL